MLTWLIVAFLFRYSSLAALAAAVFAPLFDGFLFGPSRISLAVAAMSALLIWRHRGNISKLMAGTESRTGDRKRAVKAEEAAKAADRGR